MRRQGLRRRQIRDRRTILRAVSVNPSFCADGLNLQENGLDDPDQTFYENFACGAERNYTGYCNRELEKEFDRQSAEPDIDKRKRLVWEIDKKLQEDGARPMIYHNRAASCRYPQVKGVTIMVNGIYNGWRMEDVWLDK